MRAEGVVAGWRLLRVHQLVNLIDLVLVHLVHLIQWVLVQQLYTERLRNPGVLNDALVQRLNELVLVALLLQDGDVLQGG